MSPFIVQKFTHRGLRLISCLLLVFERRSYHLFSKSTTSISEILFTYFPSELHILFEKIRYFERVYRKKIIYRDNNLPWEFSILRRGLNQNRETWQVYYCCVIVVVWLPFTQTTHISCILSNLLNLIYFDLICLISFSPQYSSFIWRVIIRCKYGFHDCAEFLNYQKSPVSFSLHVVLYVVSADATSGFSFIPIIFRKCQNNLWLVKKTKHNCLGSI